MYFFTVSAFSAEDLGYDFINLDVGAVTQPNAKLLCEENQAKLVSVFTDEIQQNLLQFLENKVKKRFWLSAEKVGLL